MVKGVKKDFYETYALNQILLSTLLPFSN